MGKVTPLPRNIIGAFINDPRGVRAIEDLQSDSVGMTDALASATFLTTSDQAAVLGESRTIKEADGEITAVDDPANRTFTLGLADTAVTAGSYGDASNLVSLTVDDKGRITSASQSALNSDNVAEGLSHLFYTDARARSALSAGTGLSYDSLTGKFSAAAAGTYGAPTGTLSRSTFASYSSPTISNPPTQAEVQAVADALQIVSRTLAALITDLRENGNLA